ncbi:MAG: cadherin-like beta sandwich domain-containing protein, partial [Bacilli bacterium]|nr:cadherin-like beta sandwich domain-containing protein [Bacilli bacterium]
GLISTSDNLKLQSVEYSEFTGLFNEEGYFIGAGNEFSEDEGILLTLTFEALEEGIGEVKIDGNLYKYLTCVSFDELAFNVNVIPFTAGGLSSLSSSVGNFDKPFDTETYEYVLTVPAGTTEVTLSGTLVNPEDEVFGLETYELTEDEFYTYVVAVEKDGTVTAYEIKIVRETPKEEVKEEEKKEEVVVDTPVVSPVAYVYSSNNYLKSLSIKDYEIKFEKGVLEYKVKVGPSVKSLDITAIAEDYRSRVEINGNENFKEGDNTVTIKVTAENGETREYKILVEKEAKDKAVDSEEEVGKTEKIVIIGLIILVVLGLLYLIFKKDDEGTTQNANFKEVKKDKK